MIHYVTSDIFESPAQVLVNPVNLVGVMGAGISRGFKSRFPDMYAEYRRMCTEKLLPVGCPWLYKGVPKWILNFPVKVHWKDRSDLDFIRLGLYDFVKSYNRRGIESVSFPQLGCGRGGLDWTDVKTMMEKYLDLPIDVYIHIADPDELGDDRFSTIKGI